MTDWTAVAEAAARAAFDDPFYCPDEIKESLARYVEHRVPTGGFLRAVLENNLSLAVGKADGKNVRHLPGIVRYIYNELSPLCWGSPANVQAWLAREEEVRR